MADMLTIGTLSTNAFRQALDVTSHNIANSTTEGYSRQRAEIVSNTPNVVGASFLGGGATVDTITRIQADYLQRQLNTSESQLNRYETTTSLARQVEGIVASNDEGIQEFMQRYFDSLQSLSSNPTSMTSRQLVLDEAQNLQSHVTNMSSVLEDTQRQVNDQVDDLVDEVNSRIDIVQKVNEEVERAQVYGTVPPNDLLDKRDQAILELSQYMDIKVFDQGNGVVDIHTASGRLPLVSDGIVTKLQADSSPYVDENRTEVYMTIGGTRQVISDRITGGQLGGVLDFRSNMLDPAQNDLGLTLNGLVSAVNWQHYQGYDMDGDAGGNFFTPLSTDATKSINNTGSEDGTNILVSFNPNVNVSEPPYNAASPQPDTFEEKEEFLRTAQSEIGNFTSTEYVMKYDQANDRFDFFDHQTGGPITDNSGNPLSIARGTQGTIDGMNFDFTNVSVASVNQGDSFLVKPHQAILEQFDVALVDPADIAARGQEPLADDFNPAWDDDQNGVISYTEFMNNSGFDADNNDILDATEITAAFGATASGIDKGVLLDDNGDGTISADEFSLINLSAPAAAAVGDNTNMANLASLQTREILFSDASGTPSETLLGGYSTMAANVGMYVRSSEIQLTAQQNVNDQLRMERESIAGVSLDEEAANLIRYQQAYEAAAQVISTSQSMFQTLLGVVRG